MSSVSNVGNGVTLTQTERLAFDLKVFFTELNFPIYCFEPYPFVGLTFTLTKG